MQHRNAPLTPNGRRRLVALVEEEDLTRSPPSTPGSRDGGSRRGAAARPRLPAGSLLASAHKPGDTQRGRPGAPAARCASAPAGGAVGRLRGRHPHATVLPGVDAPRLLAARQGATSKGGPRNCSRLAYAEIHDNERAQTVTEFTRRALDWWSACSRRWIGSGPSYRSSADRRAALPHWLDHYNESRRHSALGNRPPMACVRDVLGHDIWSGVLCTCRVSTPESVRRRRTARGHTFSPAQPSP
jgi:hypothetical protein